MGEKIDGIWGVCCVIFIMVAVSTTVCFVFRVYTPQEDNAVSSSHMTMTNTLREDVDIIRQDVNNISDAITKTELLIEDMANQFNSNLDLKLHKLEKEFSAKLEVNLTNIMLNFEKTISVCKLEVKEEIINVDKRLLETISDVSKLQMSNVSEFEVFANQTLKQINMSTAALEYRLETVNRSMKVMKSTETEINEAIKAHKEIVEIIINDTYNKYPKVLTGTFIAFLVIILGMNMYLQSKMTAVIEDAVRVQLHSKMTAVLEDAVRVQLQVKMKELESKMTAVLEDAVCVQLQVKMKELESNIQRTANYEPVNEPINGSDTA